MKSICCTSLLLGSLLITLPACSQDVILAEIDGSPLTLEEYEREYTRTIGSLEEAKKDSLEEYVDFLTRYVNFRVKLKEANYAGYYENEELQSEIDGYRASFAAPYLLDNEILDPFVKDLYQKQKEYIHASHIMTAFSVSPPSAADTLDAWNRIIVLRDSLMQGVPFGDLAARQSEDRSAGLSESTRGYRGDLGKFTGGQMVEAFENAAYSTPVGELSEIIRTQYGYHILKIHDRVDTKPDYLASHIMVSFAADSANAYAKIDSLKILLDQGIPFADVARQHSDDGASARNGGDLGGAIGFGNLNMDRAFLDGLFALDTPGEISDVVTSKYGLHLIRLNEILPVKTLDQEYNSLKNMVESLPRFRSAKNQLKRASRALYSSTVDTLLLARIIGGIPADSLQEYLQGLSEIDSVGTMVLMTLQDSVYTLKDFANSPFSPPLPNQTPTEQTLMYADQFLDEKAFAYRSFELEQTDTEFRSIIQNFEDGLAIFKIMEDSVWNASTQDTLRLMGHYKANRDDYHWPIRSRLIELSGTSDSLLTEATDLLASNRTWSDLAQIIADDSTWALQIDTVLVADSTGSIYDNAIGMSPGEYTDILSAYSRRTVLYMDGIEAARPKTFEEAMTDVAGDVQIILEDRFHERLRLKYRVKEFPDQLVHAFQH